MEETFYKVSETELRALLTAFHKMNVLDADGVDNWTWYMESRDSYIRDIGRRCGYPGNWDDENEYMSFEDLVENDLETLYEKV